MSSRRACCGHQGEGGNWKTERILGSWRQGEYPKTGAYRRGVRTALPRYFSRHTYRLISFPPSCYWIGLSLVLRRVTKWVFLSLKRITVGETCETSQARLQIQSLSTSSCAIGERCWCSLDSSVKMIYLPQNVVTESNTIVGTKYNYRVSSLMLINVLLLSFGPQIAFPINREKHGRRLRESSHSLSSILLPPNSLSLMALTVCFLRFQPHMSEASSAGVKVHFTSVWPEWSPSTLCWHEPWAGFHAPRLSPGNSY